MEELSKRLTNLRESKGWTKTYVANKLGIKTLSTYANYEYGLREPDMDTLKRIADLYDVTIDFLLSRTNEKNNSIIQGKEQDVQHLSDYQRMILEWAQSQPSLSMVENKEELSKILDDIAFIFEYERRKKENN